MIKELQLKAYKSVFNIKVKTSSTPTPSAVFKERTENNCFKGFFLWDNNLLIQTINWVEPHLKIE